ncbi:MAG: rhodanese-like domain-containing protein [Desulfobacterales bacterium]|nr:rhodanese-like domain-containing protein [Desulfobacterales bacterium]
MSRIEKQIFIFLVIVCCTVAPISYFIFSNVPTITPIQAKDMLVKEQENTIILDVQDKEAFEQKRIEPSLNIFYEDILQHKLPDNQMATMQGKKVIVLCDSGLAGAAVTRELRKKNINAFNVKGGIGAWIGASEKALFEGISFKTGAGDKWTNFRDAPTHEQWLAVLTGYGIKPLYTILSFILAVLLWKKKEPELKALKYSMIFFFVGENFCAANYLIFNHDSYLFEYLHSLGMVISFGFFAYALFDGIDIYVFHYSDAQKKCALLGLCGQCIKYEEVPCALQRSFIFLSFAASVVAIMPLFAELKMISYNTTIWSTSYNYSHPVVYQLFEVRYLPIVASVAFAFTALLLLFKKIDPLPVAKVVFAIAFGVAGFSFFRFILFHGYQDNLVWMEFWEEITEFIFIAGVMFILWQFRRSLLGWK